MTVMVKLTGTIKVSCLLPTTYTNKFHQNRLYLAKILSLLPAPCSPAILADNETALPLPRGARGDGEGLEVRALVYVYHAF